jgi:hypothetical protein
VRAFGIYGLNAGKSIDGKLVLEKMHPFLAAWAGGRFSGNLNYNFKLDV